MTGCERRTEGTGNVTSDGSPTTNYKKEGTPCSTLKIFIPRIRRTPIPSPISAPLAPLAGTWYGDQGVDTHPVAEGTESEPFVETLTFELLDPQNSGPQQLYGLRYHVAVTKPGELTAFHDQVGYILYEPASGKIYMTLAIPRAQVAMAEGTAKPGDKQIHLRAERGSTVNGICSNPFLEKNFQTTSWDVTFTFNDDGTISYEEDTVLVIPGVPKEFHHTDKNTLKMIAAPRPNPMMVEEGLCNRNPK